MTKGKCEAKRTMRFRWGQGSAVVVEAHGAVALRILRPILAHLHMQEQMDLAAGERLDLRLGRQAHGLDPLPAIAEHDRALPVALDKDLLSYPDAAILEFLPGLRLDRQRIGQLGPELAEEMLAGDLGGDVAQR